MTDPETAARTGAGKEGRAWRFPDVHSRALLSNAASLFGTTVLTAAFGTLYWAIAAHSFSADAVGIAGAAISAMVLLGRVATVGLGTVLMGELSQHRGSERSLVFSAVTVTTIVGVVLGAAFILSAAWISPELAVLGTPTGVAVFAIGVGTTASGFVLDQAFIGLLRGGLQLVRNTVASVIKLGLLLSLGWVGFGLLRPDASTLFLTWVLGGVVAMAMVLALPAHAIPSRSQVLWRLPGGILSLAARHHLLNLSILAPGLLLPLLVTGVLAAEAAGYFYIAFTIANVAWAIPAALSLALYASGAQDVHALSSRMRLAFTVCFGAGLVLNAVMLVAASPLLSVFGAAYSEQATMLLRVLSLGIFPVTIISLYVPIARLERRFIHGATLMVISMLIAFACVALGARIGGLDGVGAGWLIGVSVGTTPFIPTVYRYLRVPAAPTSGDLSQ